MIHNKEIVFVMKLMSGGGAERVISLLTSATVNKGFDVTLILTHQRKSEADLKDIDEKVKVISLPDETADVKESYLKSKVVMLYSRLIGKLSRMFSGKTCNRSLVLKYLASNYKNITWLKNYFKNHKKSVVVSFLYASIFYSLLSVTKHNKLIISERGDPCQSLGSKTTMAFLKSEFQKADNVVFQSPDVKKWYEENTRVTGTVIFNPIKADLPEPFFGERKKRIVNFCRITSSKNLLLLFDAFEIFSQESQEYELFVYGDASGAGDGEYFSEITEHKKKLESKDKIHILPARKDIHEEIKDYAMFVSSSDFEGMSNSMLEAMAIGLPCVCTDCPAGGARAVIKDGENGLLVPVNDAKSLSDAMKRIVKDKDLSLKLSQNAAKIREEQSLEKIINKWEDILNG